MQLFQIRESTHSRKRGVIVTSVSRIKQNRQKAPHLCPHAINAAETGFARDYKQRKKFHQFSYKSTAKSQVEHYCRYPQAPLP